MFFLHWHAIIAPKGANYAVDTCGDGNEGLEYALSAPYDGIILDIMLPGIDGLTLLTHLRARHVDCGVLLLTARDAVDDRGRGLNCGSDDYLAKPFAYEELSARLRAMLRRHAPSRSPGGAPGQTGRVPYRQGICAVGISDAQRRPGADSRTDLRPRVGLSGNL